MNNNLVQTQNTFKYHQMSLQLKAKHFYSQIAEKFGNILISEISAQRKKTSPGKSITRDLLNYSRLSSQVSPKKASPLSHTPKKLPKQESSRLLPLASKTFIIDKKNEEVSRFRERLKSTLNESRIRQQKNNSELASKIRWRKSMMSKIKKQKLGDFQIMKKKQIGIAKQMKERNKLQRQRIKTQIQLNNAFTCLERRLKTRNKTKVTEQ